MRGPSAFLGATTDNAGNPAPTATARNCRPQTSTSTSNSVEPNAAAQQVRTVQAMTTVPTPGFFASPVAFSSHDETWTTPKDFYDNLNREFGFVLDAAALRASTLVANNWYGPDHPDPARVDAFANSWAHDAHGGAVWLNPPYGRTIGQWMHRAAAEADAGATVVCLVPARTDTAWFQDTALARQSQGRAEIRYVRGRLKFGAANPAPFPSAVVVFHAAPMRTPLTPHTSHPTLVTAHRTLPT